MLDLCGGTGVLAERRARRCSHPCVWPFRRIVTAVAAAERLLAKLMMQNSCDRARHGRFPGVPARLTMRSTFAIACTTSTLCNTLIKAARRSTWCRAISVELLDSTTHNSIRSARN